jgi:Flp pilus assembly protein CpaB
VRALLSRHRRLLAAVFAAAAAALGLLVARPHPTGVPVLVAAHDLSAGTTLTPADVTERVYPARTVPAGTVRQAAGRTLSGPLRRGEPLTDVRLRDGGPLSTDRSTPGTPGADQPDAYRPDVNDPGANEPGADQPGTGQPSASQTSSSQPGAEAPGTVAVPVRLADAAVAGLLHPGDRVDVLAAKAERAGTARVVAAAVPVVAVPRPGPDAEEGAIIVVRAVREQAAVLASAAADSRLSVSIVS